jgi:Flp pilus assembly protein TadD
MTTAEVVEAIPLTEFIEPRFEAAAELLEKAVKAGCQDPNVHYLLALAYKRQGKTAEARATLRRINPPDANVLLQMGLLSLQERQLAQAEEEFARAFETDPGLYPAGHNLLLTRLAQGKIDDCTSLIPRLEALAPSADERRFLGVLRALLQSVQRVRRQGSDGAFTPLEVAPEIINLSAADERRLLQLICGLGELETAYSLLRSLAGAHPANATLQEAYVEATLAKAKDLLDRCRWGEAEQLLDNLARERAALAAADRPTQAALYNLLGCCAVLNQDFDAGAQHFAAALKLAGNDPRIHQNAALTHEFRGELAEAEPHWNRYFDLLDGRLPAPPGQPDYTQRAHRLRPRDPDTLERLFYLYNHVRRPQDARRVLQQLRELKPGEVQYELHELDLIEVKGLGDLDRMLTEIERIRKRHPHNARVEERAVALIPLMGNFCNQLTDQLNKVIDQVRDVPSYQQVNWPAVREVMHDLQREFLRLQRLVIKCLPLITHEEHRCTIRELIAHIDRKIDVCREMGA